MDSNLTQEATLIVSNNLRTISLQLSPQKTVLIKFEKRNILPGFSNISINEHIIKSSPYAEFLGILFDYKLTFNKHLLFFLKNSLSAMNILKFLCGTWWGSHAATL